MIVIPPQTVSLSTTNVPLSSYGEWLATTAYTTGALVQVTSTTPHREYEALTGTTGHPPATSASKWLELGPTNQWAMLDNSVSSQTEYSTVQATLTPTGYCDHLAMFNVDAASFALTVTATSATGTLLATTVNLESSAPTDWYAYFFQPPEYVHEYVQLIPGLYSGLSVAVNFAPLPTASTAAVGHLVLGLSQSLGTTKWGAQAGIEDFSIKDADDFGRAILVERAYAKRLTAETWMDTAQAGQVMRRLAALRATPCAWDGNPDSDSGIEPLIIFGWVSDFRIQLAFKTASYCSIEITGLT